MSSTPSGSRQLYRTIFRELSKQHNFASKIHAEKDKKRFEALAKYQRMKNAAAGIKSDPKEIESALTKASRYDSTIFRSMFLDVKPDSSNSHKEYLRAVSVFLTSQRTYKELLELYNGSLIDEDDRLHLSARRVGLELPEEK